MVRKTKVDQGVGKYKYWRRAGQGTGQDERGVTSQKRKVKPG